MNMGMQFIRVQRIELLETLRKNRDAHRAIFEKALEQYRIEAVQELEHMLEDARKNKKIRRSVQLQEPVDQTADYDRVIMMVQMSVDATIELSQQEFSQYVMDDWAWKQQFTSTTLAYAGRNASK